MKNGMVLERHDYPFMKDDNPIARVCFVTLLNIINLTEKLNYQTTHDLLTNPGNRFEFERRLERVISEVKTDNKEPVVCYYMDPDNFKYINDTYGHLIRRLFITRSQ